MDSCPVRAEQVLEGHGRPLRAMLSRPSDWAKYEIALDVALHFGPEDHSCAEKLNKNNDQVGRETLQLFKSGQTGFVVLAGRWVVERSFGWLVHWGGLLRDRAGRLDVSAARIAFAANLSGL